MRTAYLVVAFALGITAGFVVRGRTHSEPRPHDPAGYPERIEWLVPATDAYPYPQKTTLNVSGVLDGNTAAGSGNSDERPANSVTLVYPGNRRFTVVGHLKP